MGTDPEHGGCCGGECRVSSLGLNHSQPELFYTAQCRRAPIVYVLYRVVMALYFLAWLIYVFIGNGQFGYETADEKWLIYLSNWTIGVQTFSTIVRAITAIHGYVTVIRKDKEPPTTMRWYLRFQWVWYNIAITSSVFVTILFWALIYTDRPMPVHDLMFHEHGTNAIYVIIDIFITATPLRLLHLIHGMLYAAGYTIFSAIYTLAGGTNMNDSPYIYSVLDWKAKPEWAAAYAIPAVLVGVPIIWVILYGLYRLRLFIADKCCSTSVDMGTHHKRSHDMMTEM